MADYYAVNMNGAEGMCIAVSKNNNLNSSEKLEEERKLLKRKYGLHFGSTCSFVSKRFIETMALSIEKALLESA